VTPFSVVIITKDEAHDLPRCLDSLAGTDDVVVVDSGSTDATEDVCRARPHVRFLVREFDGFGTQKRFAVAQARHDWVLSLDADEELTPELAREIVALAGRDFAGAAGWEIPRNLVFMGRRFRHGRESRHRVLRLFDRRRGGFTDASVHERVELDGPVGRLRGRLLHHTYRDLDEYVEKLNLYTRLGAERLRARGRIPGRLRVVLTLPLNFLQSWIVHGNWRNGFPGFVWAWLRATHRAVRYLKARE
jgi:glycosyltransferase involved in cell wall biosynthesis